MPLGLARAAVLGGSVARSASLVVVMKESIQEGLAADIGDCDRNLDW